MTQHPKNVIYRCGNKRCREYGKEFIGMSPRDYRLATGITGVRCARCQDVVYFVRIVDKEGHDPAAHPSR